MTMTYEKTTASSPALAALASPNRSKREVSMGRMVLTLVVLDEPDVARVLLDGDRLLPSLGLPAGELRRHLEND